MLLHNWSLSFDCPRFDRQHNEHIQRGRILILAHLDTIYFLDFYRAAFKEFSARRALPRRFIPLMWQTRRLPITALMFLIAAAVGSDGEADQRSATEPEGLTFKSRVRSSDTPVVETGKLGDNSGKDSSATPSDAPDKMLEGYRQHFNRKRVEQVRIAEEIFAKPSYSGRYQVTKLMLDEIFLTVRQAQKVCVCPRFYLLH